MANADFYTGTGDKGDALYVRLSSVELLYDMTNAVMVDGSMFIMTPESYAGLKVALSL